MKKKIEFASHPANLWLVRHCVRQFLQNRAFSSREIDLMVLGVDEACTNIIRHAYHLAEDQLITLSLETIKSNGVRFRLRDYGDRFDTGKFQGRPLDQPRPGGLGMHLIRHAFDQIDYQQRRRGTLLVLTKLKPNATGLVPELAHQPN
ncbi:MAG TPA: ATP-binding protein [Chthoniobacterales bacterium]|nr:ATP-binding protein [Chthoniobacterales bacterium]